MYGVVIMNMTEGHGQKTYTLASTGEVWTHRPSDVMFVIPRFVDLQTANACGHDDSALDAHALAARVKVLQKVRELERDVEQKYHGVALRASRALDGIAELNTEEWSQVSTPEVAKLIGGKQKVTQLCVHKYLMQTYARFVAQPGDFLTTQLFWVRPKSHVEDIQKLTRMLASSDPAIDEFIRKARDIVLELRTRPSSSTTPSVDPKPLHSFNEAEQLILRVLERFNRTVRQTQRDPYAATVCTIMKRLALYPDSAVDTSMVHTFLTELGILPPWDDPVLKDRDLRLTSPKEIQQAIRSSLSTRQFPLPDEFYSHDLVEHVRHDFGDLPAFVIDDPSAQELDDAISMEHIPNEPGTYWVHVHIADPTRKLHPNHNLVKAARERSTTQYDVQQTLPMLPSSIMYQGLSLGSGREDGGSSVDHALTFSFKVDGTGQMVDYLVRASLLRNVKVISYDDVNYALGIWRPASATPFDVDTPTSYTPTKHLDEPLVADLRILDSICQKIVDNRVAEGVFWWGNPRAQVSMPNQSLPAAPRDFTRNYLFDGFPALSYEVARQEQQDVGSRRIVAECMKAACRVASLFCRDRGIPAVRRGADPMTTVIEEDLEPLLAKRNASGAIPLADVYRTQLIAPASHYTLQPDQHWQLGVPAGDGYTRVTSPLRRFSDMVMHWQIKYALADPATPPCFTSAWLKTYIAELTYKESGMATLDRRHQMFWAAKFLERWQANPLNYQDRPNPLDEFDAIVTRMPAMDMLSGRLKAQVVIPSLGMVAKMDPLDTFLEVGETYKARYTGVKLGPAPELFVKKL